MKSMLILTAVAALSTGTVAQAGKRADEAAILKIVEGMAAAQKLDDIVEAWDKDVVWFDMVVPSQAIGIKEVRQTLGAQVDAVKNIRIRIESIKIETGKEIAFAWSTQHLVADGRHGGPGLNVAFRQTDCFARKKGQWKLVHQHLSVPFDPATGKPVLGSR